MKINGRVKISNLAGVLMAGLFAALCLLTGAEAAGRKIKEIDFIHVNHSDLYRTDDNAKTTLYEGDVEINVRDIKLTADKVLLNEQENSLTAWGNVKLRRDAYDTDSEYLYLNFDEDRAHFREKVVLILKPKDFKGKPEPETRKGRLKRALLKNQTKLTCDEAVYWFERRDFWAISETPGALHVEQTGKSLDCTELTYTGAEGYLRCTGEVKVWQRDGMWLWSEAVFGEDEKPLLKRMMQDKLDVTGDILEYYEKQGEILISGRAEIDEETREDYRAVVEQPGRVMRGARIFFSDSENMFRCRGLAFLHQDDGKWLDEGGAIPADASEENREMLLGKVDLKGDEVLSYTDTNDFFVYGSGYLLATSKDGPGDIVSEPEAEEEEEPELLSNEPYELMEGAMKEREMKTLLEEDAEEEEPLEEEPEEQPELAEGEFPPHGRTQPVPLGERQKELIFEDAEYINADKLLVLSGEVSARNFRFQGSIVERITGDEIVLDTSKNDIRSIEGGFKGKLLIDDGRDLGRIGEQKEEEQGQGRAPDLGRPQPGGGRDLPFEDEDGRGTTPDTR